MPNYRAEVIGNVYLQRYHGQMTRDDVLATLADLRRARAALPEGARGMVAISVVPGDVPLPSNEARRTIDAHLHEAQGLFDDSFVVVEPGSPRAARLVVWAVNAVMRTRGIGVRLARSVAEALAATRVPALTPPAEVIARGRAAGLLGDAEPADEAPAS